MARGIETHEGYAKAEGIDGSASRTLRGMFESVLGFASPRRPEMRRPASIGMTVAQPVAGRRMALVIGIDAYEHHPKLRAARNDAKAIGTVLTSLGFAVTRILDPDRRSMSRGLRDFERRIEPGDVVFFFFAGHGVSFAGRNYLLPADILRIEAGREMDLADEGFAVDRLVDRFTTRGAALSILVLDACRTSPFALPKGLRSTGPIERGLGGMEPPPGVFIFYSAGARQAALDRLDAADHHPNSVFTRVFVEELKRPGTRLVDMAFGTQDGVDQLARSVCKIQLPAYYDGYAGRAVLK